MSEFEREVFRAHREAQEKYSYFLLAAAGAAIGLALNQTEAAVLARSQLPLAAAVLSWCISFWSGCRQLAYRTCTLHANLALLQIESGKDPGVGDHPGKIADASERVMRVIECNSEKSQQWAVAQFRFLVAGALFYVGWHILEMYLRTPGAVAS